MSDEPSSVPLPSTHFVFLSTTDWDAPQFGSRQQIARELGRRGHKVLFVEIPRALHSLISDWSGTWRTARRIGRVRVVSQNVWAFTPWPVLPIYYSPISNAINQRILAAAVRCALRSSSLKTADVLWTYWANSAPILGKLGERVRVYHCIDDFTAVPYPLVSRGSIAAMERQLCAHVHLVLARSQNLWLKCSAVQPKTLLLEGGVDPGFFDPKTAIVKELAPAGGRCVGMVGTLDDRLDVELLIASATAMPEITFALVGPIKRHRLDTSVLERIPNLHLYPPCLPEQVPGYLAGMDVCLIPYRVNAFTQSLSPIKLYEYLAMGKPVVSTALPYVEREAAHVRIAHNTEEFVAAVREALAHPPTAEQRAAWRAVAEKQSWAGQVDVIEATLAPLVKARP